MSVPRPDETGNQLLRLCGLLNGITSIDNLPTNKTQADYDRRTTLVYEALAVASRLGMPCGIRFDGTDAGGQQWPVISLTLPTGQVAWHCMATDQVYDGHTDAIKTERIEKLILHVATK